MILTYQFFVVWRRDYLRGPEALSLAHSQRGNDGRMSVPSGWQAGTPAVPRRKETLKPLALKNNKK
jgi:hypothetical protein